MSVDQAAKADVTEALTFEGIEEKRAKGSIKGVTQRSRVSFNIYEDAPEQSGFRRRVVPLVFVEVMPSVLQELTKKAPHGFYPSSVLQPYSKWLEGRGRERSIEKAFKKFASERIAGIAK
jgi:hypothetical protein